MYEIKEVILKNGPHARKRLVIEFDDPAMQIVGEFLMADASFFGGAILQEIDHVLKGEKKSAESSGNRCNALIKQDKTVIEDLFEEMDGADAYPAYEIETEKLRELIEMWLGRLENVE